MMLMIRALAVVALILAASDSGFAESGRTVKIVVPVPAGASTDFAARLMAEHIGKTHGMTVVVENRPGASGMIGTEAVSRSAPDGNTLLMTANTYLLDAQTRKASYHPVTAFAPVCLLVESPAVFVVNSASPYRTLKDLIDAAKAKPGELNMAAVGPGSTFQFGFMEFIRAAGINMTFVPYAGSAPAVTAVLGQHVSSAFSGYAVVSEQLKGEKLRALAVGTAKRIDPLPDAPTFIELGFKGLEVDNWFGIVAPAGTPGDKLAELVGWFREALDTPDVKAKFALQGLYPVGTCGDDFGALIKGHYDDYGRMIADANIKRE
jgi:tripartite-type tricarboxylate transporter receptor subunit TctC